MADALGWLAQNQLGRTAAALAEVEGDRDGAPGAPPTHATRWQRLAEMRPGSSALPSLLEFARVCSRVFACECFAAPDAPRARGAALKSKLRKSLKSKVKAQEDMRDANRRAIEVEEVLAEKVRPPPLSPRRGAVLEPSFSKQPSALLEWCPSTSGVVSIHSWSDVLARHPVCAHPSRSSGCSQLCSPYLPCSAQVRQLGERIFSFEEGGE